MARETLGPMSEPSNNERQDGRPTVASPSTDIDHSSATINPGVATSPEAQATADTIERVLAPSVDRPLPPRTSGPRFGRRAFLTGAGVLGLGALGAAVARRTGLWGENSSPTATPAPAAAPSGPAIESTPVPTATEVLQATATAPATRPAATATSIPTPTATQAPTATDIPRPTSTVEATKPPAPTEVVTAPRPEWIRAMPPVKIETDPKLATRPISPITHIGVNTADLGGEAQNTLDEGIAYGLSMWEQVADVALAEGGFDNFKFKYLATAKLPKVDPEYKPTYKPLPLSALPEGAGLDLSLVEDGEFDPTKPLTIEYSSEPQLIPLVGEGKTQNFGYTWRRLPDGAHKLVLYASDGPFTIGTTRIGDQNAANKQYSGIITGAMARTSLTFGRVDQVQSGAVSWDGRYFVKNFSGQVKYDTPGWEKMYTKLTGPITPNTFGPYAVKVDSPSIKK